MRLKALHYLYHRYLIHRTLRDPSPEVIDECVTTQNTRNSIDPLDPEYVRDPYRIFSILRENDPIHRSQTGAWALTRYDDIVSALQDERLVNSPSDYSVINGKNNDTYSCAAIANNTLPFMDPPAHTTRRALITKIFHSYIEELQLDFDHIADDLLGPLIDVKDFDLLHDFATPYTCNVFCRIMGFPEEDKDRLIEWSDWFLYLFTIIPSETIRDNIDHAIDEFRAYIYEQLKSQQSAGLETLLTKMAEITKDEAEFGVEAIVDNCILLFADGIGNSDKAITNAYLTLKAHPEELKRLLADDSIVSTTIEECLRFESPAQYIGRIASEDLSIHGKIIRKNEIVILTLASANRDPGFFEEPEKFDATRTPNRHLSFGRSRHSCVGARLVRMEIESAIRSLSPYLEKLKPSDETPVWDTRPGHRWLKKCPVSLQMSL